MNKCFGMVWFFFCEGLGKDRILTCISSPFIWAEIFLNNEFLVNSHIALPITQNSFLISLPPALPKPTTTDRSWFYFSTLLLEWEEFRKKVADRVAGTLEWGFKHQSWHFWDLFCTILVTSDYFPVSLSNPNYFQNNIPITQPWLGQSLAWQTSTTSLWPNNFSHI